jgi:NTP pyrophosphatase (non-canonical NTP hydrolase)
MRGSEITDLYERSWSTWGAQPQLNMLAEESAELIKAALKFSRKVNGSTKVDLMEEIADVEIMIDQVKHCLKLSPQAIDDIKQRKLNRLLAILAEGVI